MAAKNLLPSTPFVLSLIFLFSIILHSKPQTTSNKEQRLILLQIKQEFSNPPALDTWNNSTSTNLCNWKGIQCNSHGSVSEIVLPDENIAGQFPPSVCDLADLTYLNLNNNSVSGPFPTSLYNCSNLQYLDLSQNLLVGNLPDDINRLPPKLTDLILTGNNFAGDIPASIGQLPAIQNLCLDYNLFDGALPAEIGNLSTLQTLWLNNNPFPVTTTMPPSFGNLTGLVELRMRQVNLGGEIPDSLGKLAKLQLLDLSINSLVGRIPDDIWALEDLQFLFLYKNQLSDTINGTVIKALSFESIDVSMNQLTGRIPDDFGGLKNLSFLLLYQNQFSGEIPASIGLLPSLTDLRLYNNRLSGGLPPELGKHSPLWNVEVDDNLLSGEIPSDLCAGGALVSIILFNNYFSGNLPASLNNCSTLSNLMIHRNNFSGEIPAGIWTKAVNLTTLMIGDNSLSGTLPTILPPNLTRLQLQNNKFAGNLPSMAKNLVYFDASNNLLSGEIPTNLQTFSKLNILSLASNKISGAIPSEISNLKYLTNLNLSNNNLTGTIPSSISTIPVLTSLDLSSNDLSGRIPSTISTLNLNLLNLSSNNFSGEIPITLQSNEYSQSFVSNPFLCSSDFNLHVKPCKSMLKDSNTVARGVMILIIIVIVILFIITAGVFTFFYRRRVEFDRDWKMTPFQPLDFTDETIVRGIKEENIVGKGGSGKVYRVVTGFRYVAVKRMWKMDKEIETELKILGSIRHNNIVRLLCCVFCEEEKLLVYEYMENGSLDLWLHGGHREMEWLDRVGVAIGVAQGLSYMHHEVSPPVVHRDVKSSNILLDSRLRPKIADFGLARLMDRTGRVQSMSKVVGSFGYIAPECGYTDRVSVKVDVYSFGVVLMELITGREASDGGEFGSLVELVWRHFQQGKKILELVDKRIRDSVHLDEIGMMLKLAIICTREQPSTRPSMKEVLQILLRCEGFGGKDERASSEQESDSDMLLLNQSSSQRDKRNLKFEVSNLVDLSNIV